MSEQFSHIPVLAERCFELLAPALTRHCDDASGVIMVDATVGLGGHSEYFLSRLSGLKVVGIDRDEQAIARAQERLLPFGSRFKAYQARFDSLPEIIQQQPWTDSIVGILADFGCSSLQLDDSSRGFSYSHDAPLDMRMDSRPAPTAATLLATMDQKELAQILWDYGEEKFSRSIAAQIVKNRTDNPIETTSQLVDIIYRAIPASKRRTGGNPAKRTFQALRIAVNSELEAIENFLPRAFSQLDYLGRMVCLSFQSLEDKIVKRFISEVTRSRTPAKLPMELPGNEPSGRSLVRGSEGASQSEKEHNQRAQSVRLRAVEKIVHTNGGNIYA